ncbi:MAG TPA: hypothetical protein VLA83_19045 [Candidatus Binatia bacterium]|nr:hypothetical protein [Candidatus Binatia bacterium]
MSFLLLSVLAGCGGSNNTQNPPPPTVGQIYVARATFGQVLRFRAGDNGNIAPQQSFDSQAHPVSMCIDVAHNRIGATSHDGPAIVLLIDNVSSFAGAIRMISGAATTMRGPAGCALDGNADLIYIIDGGATSNILVFAPASTAVGNIAPSRVILLPYTAISIALDPVSNRLFVADSTNNVINVYDSASTLNGAVTPSRTIGGPQTQLTHVGSIALESSGHLAVVSGGTTIRVFSNAATLNGNVSPSAAFSLLLDDIEQIAVTPAGDLYTTDSLNILAFSNVFSATGTLAPVRIIAGPNTQLPSIIPAIPPLVDGIAIDPTR